MFRGLLKLIILIVVLVGVGGFLLGWWGSGRSLLPDSAGVDTKRAREVGAQVGEKTAEAASQAKAALDDGALTAKIKSKMALDDSVKALNIDVDTTKGIVTISGTVRSQSEHQRALQLAKETNGVREVVDRLVIKP